MPRECSGPAVEARPDLGGRGDGRRRGLSVYERAPPAEGGAGGSGTPSPRDLNPGSVGLHPPEKDGPAGRRVMQTGGGPRGRRGLRAPARARETSTRRLPPPRRRRGRKPSQPTLRAPQASLDPASHRTEALLRGRRAQGAAHSTAARAGFCFETGAASNRGGDSAARAGRARGNPGTRQRPEHSGLLRGRGSATCTPCRPVNCGGRRSSSRRCPRFADGRGFCRDGPRPRTRSGERPRAVALIREEALRLLWTAAHGGQPGMSYPERSPLS